jgi:hypothetical protein
VTTEERLQEAAALGDKMLELLDEVTDHGAGAGGSQFIGLTQRWGTLMGDCQRAGLVDAPEHPEDPMEEWGSHGGSD